MNFNTSPIAFFPSRAAQIWRAWFAQRKISVICGNDLLPFYIIDNGSAPATGELYDPNTDVKVADINFQDHLLDHDITVDGQSAHIWIYQGEMAGVFGRMNPGYYYLKIGNWYSDVFRIGALSSEYTEISWQFYDDIITADGTPISKHIKYKQIFETPLWHPEYNVEEEGKTNNGIFFAMQQTTKKTSGFTAIVNESQLDCLHLTRMADNITIRASINGTTKTMQTNQFEISSKWESDDVASIDVQFDLFAIIRKYQQSNVEPQPLPIPTPPPPPSLKKITGTTSENIASIGIEINGVAQTISCANKAFEFGYDDELVGVVNFTTNKDKIKTLDFSAAGTMAQVTKMNFENMPALTSANFDGVTFEGMTNAYSMFYGSNLTSISMPNATFENVPSAKYMFSGMRNVTSISLPAATFASCTDANAMFLDCKATTINMPNALFSLTTDVAMMFHGINVAGITMPAATFAAATDMSAMFQEGSGDMNFATKFPSCAAQPTDTSAMFRNFAGNINIQSLDCSNVTTADSMFAEATSDKIEVPSSLGNITSGRAMFSKCKAAAVDYAVADLGALNSLLDASQMFLGLKGTSGTSVSWSGMQFGLVTNVTHMFEAVEIGSITLSDATFGRVTNANNMFYNCANLHTISIPECTFAFMDNNQTNEPIAYCNQVQNYNMKSGTTLGVTSGTFIFRAKLPKFTKASIISILNAGRTGGGTNKLQIMSSVWNAFSAADRTEINNACKAGWTIETI